MCRHIGYLGPPRSLSELVLDPRHSLLCQSYAPAEMRGGATLNADGFGIGFWHDGAAARYRRSVPMWTDGNLPELCRVTCAEALLCAVRSATPGMPLTESACAPFTDGNWLFSHNGVVSGWPDSVAPLAKRLPAADLLTLTAATDSALLWALLRTELARGTEPGAAMASLVAEVAALAPASRLNLLLGDGHRLYATTWRHSLSVLRTPDATVIASEPYDADERWEPVVDGRLVTAGPGFVEQRSIGDC